MKVLRLGRLEIAFLRNPRGPKHAEILVDWNPRSDTDWWRFQVSTRPLWMPMGFPRPTRHSRRGLLYWAYWGMQ